MTDKKDIPAFDTLEEAYTWMYETVDDPCVDNTRFAWADNEAEMAEYDEARNDGCCGSFDAEITIAGHAATIGCNYGH